MTEQMQKCTHCKVGTFNRRPATKAEVFNWRLPKEAEVDACDYCGKITDESIAGLVGSQRASNFEKSTKQERGAEQKA